MYLVLVKDQDNLGSFERIKAIAKRYATTISLGMEKEIPSLERWEALYIDISKMGFSADQRAFNALMDTLFLTLDLCNTRLVDEMHIVNIDGTKYLRGWAD